MCVRSSSGDLSFLREVPLSASVPTPDPAHSDVPSAGGVGVRFHARGSVARARLLAAVVVAAAVACGVFVGGVSPAHAVSAGGTPDTAFSTNIGTGPDGNVRSVAVQADGKILVGGDFTSVNGMTSIRIARLKSVSPQSQAPISKKLKTPGTTVVNKKNARTVQGQRMKAKVTKVRIKGLATRGDIRCYRAIKGRKRKVALKVTGQCKKAKIWVTYTAPGADAYLPYTNTIPFVGKRR